MTASADSGPGSLRQAIVAANANPGADLIRISGFAGVLVVDTPLPDLTDDVSVDGLDDGQTLLIQPSSDFRIFNIAGANVTLANLEFENGKAARGGAVQNGAGRLILLNARFSNNSATGTAAGDGGAIYSSGPVVARNCSFGGNSAPGASGSGGAILMNGASLEVRGGQLSSSFANRAGGAIETRWRARDGDWHRF